jgi:hypothetical protein
MDNIVITLFVAATASIIAGIILNYIFGIGKHKKQTNSIAPLEKGAQEGIDSLNSNKGQGPIIHTGNQTLPAPVKTHQDVTNHGLNISPKQIIDYIDEQPPLQRVTAGKIYVGIQITWTVKLKFCHEGVSGVHLMLLPEKSERPWIYCDCKLEDYPELKSCKSGQPIIIEGEIDRIEPNTGIYLKSCRLRFI